MHVLLLPSWYPERASDVRGSFFREQALSLVKAGCTVGVISLGFRSLKTPIRSLKAASGLQIENDCEIITYRKYGIDWLPRVRRLREARIKKWGMSAFEQYVRENGMPDVVHVHSIINSGLVALEIKNKYAVPYVVTEHSTGYARKLYSERQCHWAAIVADNATRRFAVSTPFARLMATSLRQPLNSWAVMPNVVSSRFFEAPAETQQKNLDVQREFVFLNVCLLHKKKRIDLLLDAFAEEFSGQTNVRLRIGGDGEARIQLEEQAVRLGIKRQVDFLGMLKREQVVEEMNRMDAFVLSSQYETFGVVVAEALAKGKPVIATRCGGPEDIVLQGDGLLVEKDNVEEFASALRDMRENINKYDSITIRQRCQQRYGEEAIAARLLAIYREISHSSASGMGLAGADEK